LMFTSWSKNKASTIKAFCQGQNRATSRQWKAALNYDDDFPVEHRISYNMLVVGIAGSGKTTLLNTMQQSVTGQYGDLTTCGDAEECTTRMGQIQVDGVPVSLIDCRGTHWVDELEQIEVQNILDGRYQPGERIRRERNSNGDGLAEEKKLAQQPQAPFANQIHGALFVFRANDPSLLAGTAKDVYKPLRSLMQKRGMQPICVLTHYDKLTGWSWRSQLEVAKARASALCGCSPEHVFVLSSATKADQRLASETENVCLDIFLRSLVECEKYHLTVVQLEKLRQNRTNSSS